MWVSIVAAAALGCVALCVTALAGVAWSLHAQRWGRTIHAHADGEVHEHPGGNRPHRHPLFRERYHTVLTRVMGPPPGH